jgi:hypothetical protein
MNRIAVLLILLGLAACAPREDNVQGRALGGMRGEVLVPITDAYRRNGVGSMIELKDGRLYFLATRYRLKHGVSTDHWPSDITSMISSDGGRTWTKPRIQFRGPGPSAVQPGLARLANGELGVNYSRIIDGAKAFNVFRWSSDEGRTWSGEIAISPTDGYWTSAHDRLVVLSTGRLVIPLHRIIDGVRDQLTTRVAWSDDNGRTWSISPQMVNVTGAIRNNVGPTWRPSFWEASIVERKDGSLLMLGRTLAGGLYATTSTDGGIRWTEPVPTTLVTGGSPGHVVRLPGAEGKLMVIWNRCCLSPDSALMGRRLTLSSAISDDGGQTWGRIRDIESIAPVGRVEYPSILIARDNIFLTYRVIGGPVAKSGTQEFLAVLPISWFDVEGDFHRPETAIAKASAPAT